MRCTLIIYSDLKRELKYWFETVPHSDGISEIHYPELSSEQIREVEETVWDKVQEVLSKL